MTKIRTTITIEPEIHRRAEEFIFAKKAKGIRLNFSELVEKLVLSVIDKKTDFQKILEPCEDLFQQAFDLQGAVSMETLRLTILIKMPFNQRKQFRNLWPEEYKVFVERFGESFVFDGKIAKEFGLDTES